MSLQFLLPCSCGSKLPVDPAQAGGRVRCACGRELDVPTLLGLKRLERAGSDAVDGAAGTRQTTWGARQRLIFAGVVVSLVGIVVAVESFRTRPRIVDVAEYPPVAAFHLWESLKAGVDQPPSRVEIIMFAAIKQHHRWTMVGLAIAALGVLLATGSLLVRSRSFAKPPPN